MMNRGCRRTGRSVPQRCQSDRWPTSRDAQNDEENLAPRRLLWQLCREEHVRSSLNHSVSMRGRGRTLALGSRTVPRRELGQAGRALWPGEGYAQPAQAPHPPGGNRLSPPPVGAQPGHTARATTILPANRAGTLANSRSPFGHSRSGCRFSRIGKSRALPSWSTGRRKQVPGRPVGFPSFSQRPRHRSGVNDQARSRLARHVK